MPPGERQTSPETSLIIRTFNEEAYLPGLLESLQQQVYRDLEIVVVDSGSLDRTREIAGRWADKLIRINSHDFTFGYSLNVGIQEASGKFIAIASAHTLPADGEWLGALVEPLRDAPTAMSYGRQIGWSSSKFSEARDLSRTFGIRVKVQRPPHYFAHNGNSAIRKDLWQEHPFDESLPGLEDIEWAKYWMQRGYQVVYRPTAVLHHIHREQWRQIRRRYYREAVAARCIGLKGKRHILYDTAGEVGHTFLDLGHALLSAGRPTPSQTTVLQKAGEIVLFRANKAMATVAGLMDGKGAQDPATREQLLFDRTCQAVVLHGPGRASLDTVSLPELKPGDAMIRVAFNGICGRDLEVVRGAPEATQSGATYPFVLGHELSGRIVAAGANVTHLAEGDKVVVESIWTCGGCQHCRRDNWTACPEKKELGAGRGVGGGCAEYVVVPSRFVHPIPAELDLRRAALCEPLAIVLKGLNRLARFWPAKPQIKRCAVVGAGSQGHLCARALALQGHAVTVFDQDPLRRSYFQGSGIEAASDIHHMEDFDVLVEATGDPDVLDVMLNESPAGTTILLLGLPYSYRAFTFERIAAYDKTVVGSTGSGSQEFQEAIALLPRLDLGQFLECVVPLDQFREAWELCRQRSHLKVLLEVDGSCVDSPPWAGTRPGRPSPKR